VTAKKGPKKKQYDIRGLVPVPLVYSLRYPPEIELILRIKNAYRGLYVPFDPSTGSYMGEPKEGIGAIVFISTEIAVQTIVGHPHLIQDEMDPVVHDLIADWWRPDPMVFRPAFRDLLTSYTRECWLSGFGFGERYFPGLDWEAVKDSYLKGQIPGDTCETVIIRPSENVLVVRDEETGFISWAPYFFRYEAAREGEPTTDYVGPFHMNQVVAGAIHTTSMTDYYGMSPFAPQMSEITSVGKGFRVISTIARDTVKPRFAVSLTSDSGEEELGMAQSAAQTFVDAMDQGESDSALVIPNSTRVDWLIHRLNLKDCYEFIRGMHQLIESYLGIPETMLFSEANRSNTELQTEQFDRRMGWYRNVIWGWWERHFRLLLLENGIPDWDTTPIKVAWEEFEDESGSAETANLPPEPSVDFDLPQNLPPNATVAPPIITNEVI
jgi:hypothetical protein